MQKNDNQNKKNANSRKMRVVFMGSPEFACPSLQALITAENIDVVAVFSQPARPAGRGKKLRNTPVHDLALKHEINVFTPLKLDAEAQATLTDLNADIIAVAAYGLILPEAVLNIAPCINVHPSALPRWRGAAPIQRAVLAGDRSTDVCIMEMEKGLDSGAVYKRQQYDISPENTSGDMHDYLAEEGAKMLIKVISDWDNYNANKIKQSAEGIVYAHKFLPEDLKQLRKINFNKPAEEVLWQINGLSPWPGATAMHDDTELKLLRCITAKASEHGLDNNKNYQAGEVAIVYSNKNESKLIIACKEGFLSILEAQKPSKRPMQIQDFLQGYSIKAGDILC